MHGPQFNSYAKMEIILKCKPAKREIMLMLY